MQSNNPFILKPDDVRAGDIVLCFSRMTAEQAKTITGCSYSHACIALGGVLVAESTTRGVRETLLEDLMEEYDHLAVLRQPDVWTADRVNALRTFIKQVVSSGARFNFDGVRNFEFRRHEHEAQVMYKVAQYFDGNTTAPAGARERYFCSELVAAAFVHLGIVHPSAAVAFDPAVSSPAQLNDGAYGFFAGYIVPREAYNIVDHDDFALSTPYHEIFEQEF